MRGPWRMLGKGEHVRIVAPDGSIRCETTAYYSGNMFIVEDMQADMEPGDELRRRLPNGKDDVFNIDDPRLYDTEMMPAHYQVKVSRKGTLPHNGGGHLISVTGDNARVNLHSTDNSTNIANSGDVFQEMRVAVGQGISDEAKRAEIIAAINEAEKAKGTSGFASAYQRVVSAAADHITVIAPFLPALSALLQA